MKVVTERDPISVDDIRRTAAARFGDLVKAVLRLSQRAVARALELIDLTLDDPRQRGSVARLREICRSREVLLDFDVFACAAANLRR